MGRVRKRQSAIWVRRVRAEAFYQQQAMEEAEEAVWEAVGEEAVGDRGGGRGGQAVGQEAVGQEAVEERRRLHRRSPVYGCCVRVACCSWWGRPCCKLCSIPLYETRPRTLGIAEGGGQVEGSGQV
jgi:hypothetical protein